MAIISGQKNGHFERGASNKLASGMHKIHQQQETRPQTMVNIGNQRHSSNLTANHLAIQNPNNSDGLEETCSSSSQQSFASGSEYLSPHLAQSELPQDQGLRYLPYGRKNDQTFVKVETQLHRQASDLAPVQHEHHLARSYPQQLVFNNKQLNEGHFPDQQVRQRQQQHRHLASVVPPISQKRHQRIQSEVHQQLERIYGDNGRHHQAREFTDADDSALVRQQSQPQQINGDPDPIPRQLNHSNLNSQNQRNIRSASYFQSKNMADSSNVDHVADFMDRELQFRSHVMRGAENQGANFHPISGQEQAYDSLGPPGILKNNQPTSRDHIAASRQAGAAGNDPRRLPRPPRSSSKELQISGSNLGHKQRSSDEDEQQEDERELQSAHHDARTLAKPTKRAAIERRNHLEDLHYATVTAAALLSATANAAAAFAAKERKLEAHESLTEFPQSSNSVDEAVTVYSDSYQYLRRPRPRLAVDPHAEQQLQLGPSLPARYHDSPIQLQQKIYALEPPAQRAQRRIVPPMNLSSAVSTIYSPPMRSVSVSQPPPMAMCHPLNHQLHNLMMQQRHYGPAQLQHQPPLPSTQTQIQRPSTKVQPLAGLQMMMAPQLGSSPGPLAVQPMARQDGAGMMPTSAGKGLSLRADMLGRLLMNNMLAAQRVAFEGQSAANLALTYAPHQRLEAPAKSHKHGADQSVVPAQARDGQSHDRQIIQLPPAGPPVAASRGKKNNSASRNDRKPREPRLIERICRIDLRLFWWSLLIAALFFIAFLTGVTRYLVQ